MANFVESATLILIDKASGPAKKINTALNSMFNTAKKLEGLSKSALTIKANTTQIKKATADIKKLEQSIVSASNKTITIKTSRTQLSRALTDIKKLEKMIADLSAKQIRFNANTRALDQALAKIRLMQAAAGRPITIRTNASVPNASGPNAGFNDSAMSGRIGRIIERALSLAVYNMASNVTDSAAKGIMALDDARMQARMALGNDPQFEAKNAALFRVSEETVTQKYTNVRQGDLAASLLGQQQYITSTDSLRETANRMGKEISILSAIYKDQNIGAKAGIAFDKALIAANAAGTTDRSREMTDALLRQMILSQSDLAPDEPKRMFQQLARAANVIEPIAAALLLGQREEEGRQSTAEARMAVAGFTRMSITDDNMALQKAFGLRDKTGAPTMADAVAENPYRVAFEFLKPKLQKLGVNTDSVTDVFVALNQTAGLLDTEARFMAEALGREKEIRAQMEAYKGTKLDAVDDPNAGLRMGAARVNAAFGTMMGKVVTPLVPTLEKAMNNMSRLMVKQTEGTLTDEEKTQLVTLTAETAAGYALVTGAVDTSPLGRAGTVMGLAASTMLDAAGKIAGAALLWDAGKRASDLLLADAESGDKQSIIKAEQEVTAAKENQKIVAERTGFWDFAGERVKATTRLGLALEQLDAAKVAYAKSANGIQDARDLEIATIKKNQSDPNFVSNPALREEMALQLATLQKQDVALRNGRNMEGLNKTVLDRIFTEKTDIAFAKNATMQGAYNASLQSGITAVQGFTQSLRNTDGSFKSYADQLRSLQEKEGMDVTGKRTKQTEWLKDDITQTLDKVFKLKADKQFGADNLKALGFDSGKGTKKDIATMQSLLGVPSDGIYGPITAAALEGSQLLKDAVAKLASSMAFNKASEESLKKPPTFQPEKGLGVTDIRGDTDVADIPPESKAVDIGSMLMSAKSTLEGVLFGGVGDITTAGQAAATAIGSAVVGAGSSIAGAFATGGDSAAGKIRAALSTPVNVNVNTNSVSKPVNTGLNSLPAGVR